MIEDKIYSYFDRNPGLHVLFFFDPSGMKEEELADVQWREGYRFLAPRGGWFSIKYLIDRDWADDKVILYFAQLSPFKRKQEFPLMDLLRANMEYHDEDYAAFMQHYRLKSDYAPYVSSHIAELQSDKMLALLKPHFADGTFNTDLANRAFITLYLAKTPKLVLDWQSIIIRLILLADPDEAPKRSAFYGRLDKNKDAYRAIDYKLERIFGSKLQLNLERLNVIVQKLKYNYIVQTLPVSPADNYKQLRITEHTSLQLLNSLMEAALNDNRVSARVRKVIGTLAADVRDAEIIASYGLDADYWKVTPGMAKAILEAIVRELIETEPQQAIDRIHNVTLKCTNFNAIASAACCATLMATYYLTAKQIKSVKLNSPDEYVVRYRSDLHQLDMYYRQSLSAMLKCDEGSPLHPTLQQAKQRLDAHYHNLTNRINLEWSACIAESGGLKSITLPRQQDFYTRWVKPLGGTKVAVIISDALRYELAVELEQRLTQLRHPLRMDAALAMLPTETCYCKPALLPHKRLCYYGPGQMSVDDKLLNDLNSREAHLSGVIANAKCETTEMLKNMTLEEKRELFKSPLVYLYHDVVDHNSHHAGAADILNNCNRAVDELAQLVKSLLSSWNVTHVIVTSDHGFLFNDITFEEKDKLKVNDEFVELKSRYYVTHNAQDVEGVVKYAMNEAGGYAESDLVVGVPEGTNRLSVPGGDYMFCHGGATLQEMIIPLVTCHRTNEEQRLPVDVMVLEPNLRMTSSRLRVTLLQTETVGSSRRERTVICKIQDGDTQVSPTLTITLNSAEATPDARKFPVELTLNQPTTASVLELLIYDADDLMNPYIKKSITNNTLIQMDDF